EMFKELCTKARQLGGNYSRAWNDSPAGFMFNEREQAEKFMTLRERDVSQLDEIQEQKEEAEERAAERLLEVADSLEERATETLSSDRKVNTARRASIASTVEGEAQRQIRIAKTMERIAEAILNGQVKHLSGVR